MTRTVASDTVIRPTPPGIACHALVQRFITTWWMRERSASTFGTSRAKPGDHLDARRQRGPQQPDRFLDDLAQPDDAPLVRLPPPEGEDLLDELAGARARLLDFGQALLRRMLRHEILPRQFDVADDRAEDVVEVVGDAAGEGAEGLHLLRLAQRRLEPLPRRLGVLADPGCP